MATELWESELLCARQWLAATRQERQERRAHVFRRVQSHIRFRDHQRSLLSAVAASEDEDDELALDFLGDVDVADMDVLLRAEANKAAAKAPALEADEAQEAKMPTAQELMRPLEMPPSLASPRKAVAVPMSQLKPKNLNGDRDVQAGAKLGNDAAVKELMQDLQLDVAQLPSDAEQEEHKTEESTPPHLLKNFGGVRNGSTLAVLGRLASHGVGVARPDPNKYMQQATTKSPTEPQRKIATAATNKSDDVTGEMMSWVTGYRDPEVIRRKESMARRKKEAPHLFGVSSEEERRQALLALKQITHRSSSSSSSSDSNSDGDFSSDYTPAEEEEAPEPEEPDDDVVLLSDDYLNTDEETRPKRKRKRLRQSHALQKKKKTRSRKPAVTRKLSQSDASSTPPTQPGERPTLGISKHITDKLETINSSVEKSGDVTGKAAEPIDLLSSGDESEDGDATVLNKSAGSVDTCTTASETRTPSEVEKRVSPTKQTEKALIIVTSAKVVTQIADEKERGSPGQQDVANDVLAQLLAQKLGGDAELSDTGTIDAGSDAELSDTGTVDMEGEELTIDSEKDSQDEEAAAPEGIVEDDAIAEESTIVPDTGSKLVDGEPSAAVSVNDQSEDGKADAKKKAEYGETQQIGDADDADVSEAETEVLEEDDLASDDLGLDYSDDSDSGQQNTGIENGGTSSDTQKAADSKHGNSEPEQKPEDDKKDNKTSGSKSGVQQFFQFPPLQLKPAAKPATTRKPLPIHNYADTHIKKSDDTAEKAASVSKKPLVTPTKPSIGSNGLRPSKKPIATTTSMKGKYALTRRSTKLLSPEETPGGKPRHRKSEYTIVPTRTPTQGGDMSLLAKEMSKNSKSSNKSGTRYLSYDGAKKTEDAPRLSAETPRIVSKSRYGGGAQSLGPTAVQDSSATSNGGSENGTGTVKGYRREAQISIYDALHMHGQENAIDIRDGASYKRPSRFKKMQAEAAEKGIPMVRPTRLQDTDWDKVPIPKKKKQPPPQPEKLSQPRKTSVAKEHGFSSAGGKNKSRKKGSGPKKNPGPSYYGPAASQSASRSASKDKYDSPSRDRRGNNLKRDDDRRKRSPSPYYRDRDRLKRGDRDRDDRRRRGSSRSRSRSYSRSRSPSSRSRDYNSSRHRRRSRSRSRSRSREKSNGYDRRHTERSPSSVDRDVGKKRSLDPASNPPEFGEVLQNGGSTCVLKDYATAPTWTAKKQKISHRTDDPPPSGALATFDDNDGDIFISDSDDEVNVVIKEVEDIRFDLESVTMDEALMARQVYVTGVNPTVCAEQIEEDFAPFGVAVDQDTGFPAIDIFPCQRNHLGRGDACITFKTEEGAQAAVEELNSKNIKNSMIRVRRMDVHTQRILTVQFKTVRDTWKCTGKQCRVDVSIWNAKCNKCGRKRVYGPSNIKIGAESWLCSLCFTANDAFATSCHGCMESLPEVDRSTFYST